MAEVTMNRKEKRKSLKKTKRKLLRRERAIEEQSLLSDPAEELRLRSAELEESERSLRERLLWEEREKAWLDARAKRDDEERLRIDVKIDDDGEKCEFVEEEEEEEDEEGPPEIIWQGNEIILKKRKKKKIRVSDSDSTSKTTKDTERPISNPLPPPESDQNSSLVTTKDLIESVVQQVPNFGTEQDKNHCPFHLKTGVCRFGQRCNRVHFYPDKACTLLIKNMYNGPGLAWDQDEGLECTDEEVERSYEEFYEDVHTEFLKFGEIVNFKVCRNGSYHLRGNVYVHFKSLDSAVLAYQSINARYFAGKQVSCEFVNVNRWKVAICGEYTKTRYKTCSRGTACNFIHCFRNPGGEYEWSDYDNPPPRYWVKKMIALFGYSDESTHERQKAQENWDQPNSSSNMSATDMDRHHSRISRSRERDHLHHSGSSSRKNHEDYDRRRRDKITDEDMMYLKDDHQRKRKKYHCDARESYDGHGRKSSRKSDYHNYGSDGERDDHRYTKNSSKNQKKSDKWDDHVNYESKPHEDNKDGRGKRRADEKYYDTTRKTSSRHSWKDKNPGDDDDSIKELSVNKEEVGEEVNSRRVNKSSKDNRRERSKLNTFEGVDYSNGKKVLSNDSSCSSVYDCDSRYKYDEEIDKRDRWEPEPEFESELLFYEREHM